MRKKFNDKTMEIKNGIMQNNRKRDNGKMEYGNGQSLTMKKKR